MSTPDLLVLYDSDDSQRSLPSEFIVIHRFVSGRSCVAIRSANINYNTIISRFGETVVVADSYSTDQIRGLAHGSSSWASFVSQVCEVDGTWIAITTCAQSTHIHTSLFSPVPVFWIDNASGGG